MNRRIFLRNTGFVLGATATLPALAGNGSKQFQVSQKVDYNSWASIREQFLLTPDRIHMAQMLLASHPTPVREAIEMHRKKLDENPFEYFWEMEFKGDKIVCEAAANYMKVDPEEIALTDSTTVGLGLLYTGLKLKKGDEILTTTHDHYSTEKSLEFAAQKNGATVKRVSLYTDASKAKADEMVDVLIKAIKPSTRIVAVTWVHSVSGIKLPIRKIADAIRLINEKRDQSDRIYFCVDGVHGFGVENVSISELGCDFFVAGTHKWIFGPRGTGILWAKKDAWDRVIPTIPAFRWNPYGMWMGIVPEAKISFGDLQSPGGFTAFDHRWSLNVAFEFQMKIGKDKIGERTHQLSSMLKDGLRQIRHVKLHTPLDPSLSSGINVFEVEGMKPDDVMKKLLEKKIVASTTPYKVIYPRLTPCIINTEEEIKKCVEVVENLKA